MTAAGTDREIRFRAANDADLPFLIRLRAATMREHVENSGIAYEDDAQLARIEYRFEFARIIACNGQDIGLLKMDRSVSPWMLIQIQLLPDFQRKRMGEAILRQILADADNAKTNVTLKVLKANPAKRLYERVGFRFVDEDERSFFMQYP